MAHLDVVLAQLPTDACVLWPGACYGPPGKPYGKAGLSGLPAHRYVWKATGRTIPAGLHLDHLCRTYSCVNPAHLEPVTPRENTRRAALALTGFDGDTHCRNGHPRSAENNRRNAQGHLKCRPCQAESQRRTTEKRRAAAQERLRVEVSG